MSVKLNIYDLLKARILDQVPEVKTAALFNNQFIKEAQEDAISYPAVLIHFLAMPWTTKPQGLQESDAVIRFYVAIESYRDEERFIFELVEKLHAALNGFYSPTILGKLNRIDEEQDVDHDNLIVWQMDYSGLITDTSGHRGKDMIQASVDTIEITLDPEPPFLKHL